MRRQDDPNSSDIVEDDSLGAAEVSELVHTQLQVKLDLTDDRLRNVQRVAQLGFWDWDIQGDALYWSEEIYPIFGFAPEEFGATYDAFIEAVHPDDRAMVREAVDAALYQGVPYDIEHRVLQPNGMLLYVNEQGSVTRNEAGEPIRMLGTVINITERKMAEQIRRQREIEFQVLWESAGNGMITVNAEGIITLVNRSAEELFGYSREELMGQAVELLVPEALRETHGDYREGYQENPNARKMGESFDLRGQRKDGECISLDISLTPIVIRNAQEILVEIQDVSARKALEHQLGQSQKLEAVGRLASGIAHDLNNYLTAMIGFTELSQMQLGSEHACSENLDEVLKGGERARKMIGRMLAFTRQQVLEPKLLNIDDAVQQVRPMLKKLLRDDIELVLSLDFHLREVHVDPVQLEQVIVNLVVNSMDAMPEGGRLVISTSEIELDDEYASDHALEKGGDYVELSISDTGTGMTSDVRANIFDPFYTTKALKDGTGLGLSTVYGIVKQSKGDVAVYSEPGEGTTFKIHFPVAVGQYSSVEESDEDLSTSPGSGTVLLVEDDEGVRLLAKRLLESNGYTVYDFESAEDVLAAVDGLGQVDLVLADVVLTGMNGPELAEELKGMFPELPVLFMSGYASRALDIASTMEADTEFLSKPFTRKSLLQKVARAIR